MRKISGIAHKQTDPPIKTLVTVDNDGEREVLELTSDNPLTVDAAQVLIDAGEFSDVTTDYPI